VPDDSPKDEVGLEYEVVANPTIGAMVFTSTPDGHEPETRETGRAQSSDTKSDEIPRGNMEEVASSVSIGPGREIVFSMPINHLSERWHVEIPFDFELPPDKAHLIQIRSDFRLWLSTTQCGICLVIPKRKS